MTARGYCALCPSQNPHSLANQTRAMSLRIVSRPFASRGSGVSRKGEPSTPRRHMSVSSMHRASREQDYIPHVAHTQTFEEIISTDDVRARRHQQSTCPRPSSPYAVVLFTLFYGAAFEAKGFFAGAIAKLTAVIRSVS